MRSTIEVIRGWRSTSIFAPALERVLVLVGLLLVSGMPVTHSLARMYLMLQDRWLLLMQVLVIGLAWLSIGRVRGRALPRWAWRWAPGCLALALLLAGYAGHTAVLDGYDLSRDEQMASFDAWVYAHGRLAWPLPVAWQPDSGPLNLLFMLPVHRPIAWVSAYLPGNAMLRAGVGLLTGDPAWTGPLLTALSLLLLVGCARRLWPQDRAAQAVSLALFAGAGSVWIMAMTAYAMPAHLAANLLWLWLFLRDRRGHDALALLVGVVATGLHQPLFHPLFVAPWLVLLLAERRWARFALFAGGYAAIGLGWLLWPGVTHGLVSGPLSVTDPVGSDYLSRFLDTLRNGSSEHASLLACNMLRFIAWQHVLMLPLLLAGIRTIRRSTPDGRTSAALAAGVIGQIVVMALILPYQGHGFGYRYLHGLTGSVALLGGFGWRALAGSQAWLRPMLVRTTALGLLVLLPIQAWMAHALYAPFAAVSTRIDASHADYTVIGADDGPFALDLVLNPPDLGRKPVRLVAEEVEDFDALASRLCRTAGQVPVRVALPTGHLFTAMAAAFHAPPSPQADSRLAELTQAFSEAGCVVSRLD